jgi:predicted  nucleic acid-binding Zn-ribbon protein
MRKAKPPQARPSNNEIRHLMLQYFYDRNRNATSARGKKGSAVKISDVKKEVKSIGDRIEPVERQLREFREELNGIAPVQRNLTEVGIEIDKLRAELDSLRSRLGTRP